MKRILVVEDDTLLGNTLAYNLRAEGFFVSTAFNVSEAMAFIKKETFDLIVMDVNLPDGNGFELCRQIKKKQDIPVIFLTANDMESDMIKGFELGADDYVTKPFPIHVFQKKITALLGRLAKQPKSDIYDDGHLFIDFSQLTAKLDDEVIIFTPMEYRALKLFINNPNHVLTRQKLLEKLWDADGIFVDEHTLTSMVSRIRSKIESKGIDYIKTVYGMGYMWIGGNNES